MEKLGNIHDWPEERECADRMAERWKEYSKNRDTMSRERMDDAVADYLRVRSKGGSRHHDG